MPAVFASDAGFAGCVSACRNAAAVLGGTWVELPRDAPPPEAALGAPLLVLSSWSPRYEPLLDAAQGAVIPRWHSPLLQTELSREGWKLARMVELLDAGRVPAVAVDDPGVAAALGRERVVVLPDVLADAEYSGVAPRALEGINVSLFGEAHGRKNLLAQSAAVRLAAGDGEPWTLHLAGQPARRPGYARWLDLLGVRWVDHGWLPRGEYLALVAAMDAGLAASLSESYGYAVADHLMLGVPAVISPGVRCCALPALTVADPGDPVAVAAVLRRAVAPGERVALAAAGRADLLARAEVLRVQAAAGLAELHALAGVPA